MDKIKGRWREGNTREIRNSHGLAMPKVGIGLTWVRSGPRQADEMDLLGALVMV